MVKVDAVVLRERVETVIDAVEEATGSGASHMNIAAAYSSRGFFPRQC